MRLLGAIFLLILVTVAAPQAQDTRQFYLSPVDGTGTELDPFRSRCLGLPGGGNIDLRPDVDAFLCASNALPGDLTGVEVIGASLSGALGGKKNALDATFQKTLRAATVEEFIAEILTPKLTKGRDGKLKIYLGGGEPVYQKTAWVPFEDGGLIADLTTYATDVLEPALAWAATISDAFTASDGNLDGCCTSVWAEISGTAWTIASNQAVATGSGTLAIARNTANNFAGTDHTATLTLVNVTAGTPADGTSTSCAVLIRKEANTTQTYYRTTVTIRDSGELNETNLQKVVAGSTTILGTDTTDWSANETVTVTASGSTISGQRSGGTLMSVTDTSITAGQYYGLRYFSDYTTGSPGCTVDDLTGSDEPSRIRGGSRWYP